MNEEQQSKFWTVLQYLLQRMKEPSSWAGIALFVGFFGLSEDTINRIVNNGPAMITAVATLVAIFAPSAGRKALAEAREAKDIAQDANATVTQTLGTADLVGNQASQPMPPHGSSL